MKHLLAAVLAIILLTTYTPPTPTVQPLQPTVSCAASMPLAEPPQPVTVLDEPQAYYPITAWERALICRVMMSECAGEPLEGQHAVAQVILDRLRSEDFPGNVYDVLTQDGQFSEPSDEDATVAVYEAVAAVFDRGERVTECEILYFYSPKWYGVSEWHESREFILRIGGHKFYS